MNSPIQPDFYPAIITHIIVVIHSSSVQVIMRKGLYKLERYKLSFRQLILLLLVILDHDPRVFLRHYRVVIRILYKKYIKVNSLQITLVLVMLTYFIFFKMGIDLISINS